MNIALIVAGGSGSRMGGTTVKQLIDVNGKPLMFYALDTFNKNPNIGDIVIVMHPDHIDECEKMCNEYGLNKVSAIVPGGNTRQESVYNGLLEIEKHIHAPDDIILIHDAARALISNDIIERNIKGCDAFEAIITAIHATDTIVKSIDSDIISETLSRNELYQVQTPQTFKYNVIRYAHERAREKDIPDVTDDGKLVMLAGYQVHIVNGSKVNFKVTTEDDLILLKGILTNKGE